MTKTNTTKFQAQIAADIAYHEQVIEDNQGDALAHKLIRRDARRSIVALKRLAANK